MAPAPHDNRPLDTWRVCGQPVDTTHPHMGCDCGNTRRRILTDDQAGEQ